MTRAGEDAALARFQAAVLALVDARTAASVVRYLRASRELEEARGTRPRRPADPAAGTKKPAAA